MKVNPRLLFLALLLVLGCKDHFDPNLSFKETHFLVVEGYINVGTDAVTVIRLSRTISLREPNAESFMEAGASILIEDDQGAAYSLNEATPGIYISDTITLPLDRQYRIRISSNEKEFVSKFTIPIQTPAIDSVSWVREGWDGVNISVATHDPQNKTLYYQWDFEEIWELRSPYFSAYEYRNGSFIPRENAEISSMKTCWKRGTPRDLFIRSTTTLEEDAISLKLINIPVYHEKLSENYTVLVRQHALSVAAFNYLQIISKNTNQIGTFYDPQPSQLFGNITVPDSEEPVIGYVEAYTTAEQRIYITNNDVPNWNFDLYCNQIFTSLAEPELIGLNFGTYGWTPTVFNEFNDIGGTLPRCADCRLRGGDNDKPAFWDEVF